MANLRIQVGVLELCCDAKGRGMLAAGAVEMGHELKRNSPIFLFKEQFSLARWKRESALPAPAFLPLTLAERELTLSRVLLHVCLDACQHRRSF